MSFGLFLAEFRPEAVNFVDMSRQLDLVRSGYKWPFGPKTKCVHEEDNTEERVFAAAVTVAFSRIVNAV